MAQYVEFVVVIVGAAKKDDPLIGSGFILIYSPAGEPVLISLTAFNSISRTLNFLFELVGILLDVLYIIY